MVDAAGAFSFLGGVVVDWLSIFAAPFKNLEMLWIIIPIWGVWIFSEFFQEKEGTSFGNAITNGAVMLFVGIDWIRLVIREVSSGLAVLDTVAYTKLTISGIVILISILIIFMGIRSLEFIRLIGRVRETTYMMLMFSPVVYGVVDFSVRTLIVILAFFPFFYGLVELADKLVPAPKAFRADKRKGEQTELGGGLGLAGLGEDSFGAGQFGQEGFGQGPQGGFPEQYQQFPPQQPPQDFSRF